MQNRIQLRDDRTEVADEFYFENGISDWVASQIRHNASPYASREVVLAKGAVHDIKYEVAFGYSRPVLSFVNNLMAMEEGSHVEGFYGAFTAALNTCATEMGILDGLTITRADYASELTAAIAVRCPHPFFHGATRSRLVDEDVEQVLCNELAAEIEKHLRDHAYLVRHAVDAAKKRTGGK